MRNKHEELAELQDKLDLKFGLIFDQHRSEQVEEAFIGRQNALRMSASEYLKLLDADTAEWERLAEVLTVPESYFFRHADALRAFVEVALPGSVTGLVARRSLRILCLGCANGEEPYTLSMLCLEQKGSLSGVDVHIRGCDINRKALDRARQGLYTEWAMRVIPPRLKDHYFARIGKKYQVNEEVRRQVEFEPCNALEASAADPSGIFDIVFFRNVLIYFSPSAIRAAISGIAHLLAPGGYLFLGPAENLRGISEDFDLCHTHDTFYYQRKARIAPLLTARRRSQPRVLPPQKEAPLFSDTPNLEPGTSWMDQIEQSTERVRLLHSRPVAAPSARSMAGEESARLADAKRIRSMLPGERYGEVLQAINDLSTESRSTPDLQLLLAWTQMNLHNLEAAKIVCHSLLAADGLNPDAHYILALCEEHAGDYASASQHDRTAMYLDPAFAMPHLHAALLSRKQGDSQVSRQEFEAASQLLMREEAVRISMFGGGFSREGLRQFCQVELQALSGR